jgi:hypothetical protein
MLKRELVSFAAAGAMLTMAACGGGAGEDSAPSSGAASAQGLWIGTTATNRTITGLVLSDGSYYVLYSSVGNAATIAGVLQGSGSSTGSTFSSSNARDFNLEGLGVLPGSVSANFTSRQSFSGSVAYTGGGTTAFSTAYDANYEVSPSLTALAGTYTGQAAMSAGVQSAVVTIASSGAISSSSNGCTMTGVATPRVDGNAYNVSLSFGASPCFFANQTLSGVAYFNAATKRIYSVTPNAARSDGLLFVGTKP